MRVCVVSVLGFRGKSNGTHAWDLTDLVSLAPRSHSGIWVMSAEGRHQRQLSAGGSDYSDLVPSWSPDGHLIAFESDRDDKTGQGITQVRMGGTVGKLGKKICRSVHAAEKSSTPAGLRDGCE